MRFYVNVALGSVLAFLILIIIADFITEATVGAGTLGIVALLSYLVGGAAFYAVSRKMHTDDREMIDYWVRRCGRTVVCPQCGSDPNKLR